MSKEKRENRQHFKKKLKQAYYTVGHPLHFGSLNRLYQHFKPNLTRTDISEFLQNQHIHQIYRVLRKPVFNKMIISNIR